MRSCLCPHSDMRFHPSTLPRFHGSTIQRFNDFALAFTSPCFQCSPCVACPVSEMKSDPIENPVRVGLISLGCAKNLVDAEIMLGSLLKGGVEITNDATQADVVIVNTCSFIDA